MSLRRGTINKAAWAAILLIIVGLAVFWHSYKPSKLLEISMLDVGQGDALLVEAPDGQTILVDGGPGNTVLRRLGEELPFWERRIDLMILSHAHEDHVAGLAAVIERYDVGTLMVTGIEYENVSYDHLLETAKEKGTELYIVEKPELFTLGDISIKTLFPRESFNGKRITNINNSSIVAKLSYGEIDMLLTGDAELEEEAELITSGALEDVEILKVGHHGSDTSSSEELLLAITPEIALISCGHDNSYGHPSLRTLRRFDRLNIAYRRTDLEGTITIKTDGRQIYQ